MIPRLTSDFPRLFLIAGSFLFVALTAVAATTMEALSLNRYDAPGSESVQAREVLAEHFGTGSPNIAILVRPVSGSADDPHAASVGALLTQSLASQPGIDDAWSYWSENAPDTLAAEDGSSALILAWAPGDADHIRGEVLPRVQRELIDSFMDPAIELTLGGSDEIFRVVAAQARTDFLRAELIILPVVIALLWLVYRRLRLALVTTAVGLFSVAGTLAILRLVSVFTDVSTFASNIALVMGIGLGVDYGLFMTFRFREELRAGSDPATATRRAMRAAGRTIVFSGATVAASLAVLFVFPFPFLSSFAYAGIGVVLTAVFASTILLPAALRVLGARALPRRERPTRGAGFWERLAVAVMRRPVIAGSLGLVVLLGLGAPALGAQFGSPDDRILPAGQSVRDMYDTIRADYRAEDADAVYVLAPDTAGQDVGDYAALLSQIGGVERVDSAAGAFVDGQRIADAARGGAEGYQDAGATWLAVLPTSDRLAADPLGIVDDIRGAPAPFPTLVGGYPAELADYRAGVAERLPLVAGLILLVTFILLFLMTGSVIAPLKASVLNLLSLSVMFGVLVWGFQEGGLAWLLGFTPTGVIEPSIPLLMFCVAYGLSMDYEVFLLARIKEDFDRTGDPIGSVARGIGRSAPLVSAAAGILAVSFLVYTTSEVSFLQQLGVGMALAVLVDATVIRGILVPAFMRLAGRANWWAPAPLRRLHDRIGWHEGAGAAPAPTSAVEPEPVR
jgi:RND superfamily putative drug exporter